MNAANNVLLMYTEKSPILPHKEQIHADKLGITITLRFKIYTIDRLGVMAQKPEKMLLKIIN